jgi:hypothetical protein
MLTVLMQERSASNRIAVALGSGEPVVWAEHWDEFDRVLPFATCAIVVLGWLRGNDLDARRLGSLKERHPLRPMVLVTSKDADNARSLRSMAIDEVVWLSEIDSGLWPAVRRARASVVRQHLTGAVDQALLLDRQLQRAMRYACNAERPVRSIGQLAVACGCDRRTLWRHWHQAVSDRAGLRLEDVLDWLLLLYAVGRKTPAHSWSSVAAELQIHPHTLSRIAARLTTRPLRRLTASDQVPLTVQFHGQLIAALAGEPARNTVTRLEPSKLPPARLLGPVAARRSG